MLDKDTHLAFYWDRDPKFIPLFNKILDLAYFSNLQGVLLMPAVYEYDPNSWRLIIDVPKLSLKFDLYHNTTKYTSIAIWHLTTLKEKYVPIKQDMEQIKYIDHY